MWQAISDLICSNTFITCKFWPINSTTWGFLKRGNVGVVCKGRWLGMVSKGSVFGGWCKEKEMEILAGNRADRTVRADNNPSGQRSWR